jgi:hypothetical protein
MNIGALPYLYHKLHSKTEKSKFDEIKILGTSPIAKMGALTMYEFFIQKKENGDFDFY